MKFGKGAWLLLAAVLLLGLWVMWQYNWLVSIDEDVNRAWADVEWQYQRRADLIPNVVETVRWFADQESKVFTDVVEARAKATQTNIDISDPSSIAAFEQAQGNVTSALSRLLVTVENYPDLKSNENFLALQVELEGTENRIAVARWRYNEVVTEYAKKVRTFPANIAAKIFWFENREQFEAEEWTEVAPVVDFGADEE